VFETLTQKYINYETTQLNSKEMEKIFTLKIQPQTVTANSCVCHLCIKNVDEANTQLAVISDTK